MKPPGDPQPWNDGDTAVFHITHVDNLPGIIESGRLLCDAGCAKLDSSPRSVAYADLKERRAAFSVTVGHGGTLADYVPFYYAPRSPMLYANCTGFAGADGQGRIVHLVACAEAIAERCDVVLTDGHAATPLSTQYDSLDALDKIDWDCMDLTFWHDTDTDGDRKRRRQAEFLASDAVPWEAVRTIGVMSDEVRETVTTILQSSTHRPPVHVRREWYY